MILFVAILALFQVIILNQFDFWGAAPIMLVVLIGLFRWEARMYEHVVAGAMYAVIVGTFRPAEDAFFLFIATVFATFLAVLMIRLLRGSRWRIYIRDSRELAVVTTSFLIIYWGLLSLAHIGTFHPISFVYFLTSSILINLAISLFAVFLFKRTVPR